MRFLDIIIILLPITSEMYVVRGRAGTHAALNCQSSRRSLFMLIISKLKHLKSDNYPVYLLGRALISVIIHDRRKIIF